MRKKILVLLSRVPYPLEKGDKLRAFHQIKALSKSHDLIICALSDRVPHKEALRVLKAYAGQVYFFRLGRAGIFWRLLIQAFGRRPFQVAYFFSPRLKRKLQDIIEVHRPDHVYCQLIRTAEYVREWDMDKTIDFQDSFSLGLKRRAQAAPWYARPLFWEEYQRVLAYENRMFSIFNKKAIISAADREHLPHADKATVKVIPNGVDMDYFRPTVSQPLIELVFTGNMSYPPNINGAIYLVKQVMPKVWKSAPKTRLMIAGTSPVRAVKALASDRVIVTGWVSDIRQCYAQAQIFIAPMQMGTGMQNKVLEAMAMGLPCIASELANQAIGARDGQQVLIGKNSGNYAQHILSLLEDAEYREKLASKGRAFVAAHYDWQEVCLPLEQLIIGKQT